MDYDECVYVVGDTGTKMDMDADVNVNAEGAFQRNMCDRRLKKVCLYM